MSSNVEKVLVKLTWLKSYWAVNFVLSAILLLFLEIWWSLDCHIFLTKWRFSKTFFTFKFSSEYSFKIANLLWHKLKLIFCCQSYDVIFAPKTVKIKNPKTYDCWENKVLLSCKVSAQTVKNWKTSLKEITFWWQLTRREMLDWVACRQCNSHCMPCEPWLQFVRRGM